jgi:transketolase
MNKETAMREAFGKALLDFADKYPDLVVLDADVSNSTQTVMFAKEFPERFFNIGVAEANMVDIAGGMATCGLKPVASTFAIFISLKATDQVRNVVCYNNLPVILVGGYAGLSDSFDGTSHQSLTDVAIMRAMPNMTVLVPADGIEMKQALEIAIKINGPVYIRSSRNPSPMLFEDEPPMEKDKIRKIRDGSDITIAVNGIPTFMAIQAAEELENDGISVDLLCVSTIKPFDKDTLVKSVSKTRKILTVEEHSVIGGLGSTIAESLPEDHPVRLRMVGIHDQFTETGPYIDLLKKYGISTKNIIHKAKELVQKP